MMEDVFVVADNIISPLGKTTSENFDQLKSGLTGIRLQQDTSRSPHPFYASLFETQDQFFINENPNNYTRFEQLLTASIKEATQKCNVDLKDKNTLLIISSTKGNISLLETEKDSAALRRRISLHASASVIKNYFDAANFPLIVSNACISGLASLIVARRLLRSGKYKYVVIAGADTITRFVMSGFEAFQAVSDQICKPFDASRAGINLGEAAATIILSSVKSDENTISLSGGAMSNDANHISGPSRTGEELSLAINKSLTEAKINASDINLVSAHGTATLYNDEMEAKAFQHSGLTTVPVHSLKSYFGHTLGAAGLVESVVCIQSMRENILIPTLGFENNGVSVPLVIPGKVQSMSLNKILKTASGFGGCNAAIVFSKNNFN